MTAIHIMLDLETWGKEPGCDIRSIGATAFDPTTGYVGMKRDEIGGGVFYIATNNPITVHPEIGMMNSLEEWRRYDLDRDPGTVQWWSEQSAEAQGAFTNPVDLRDALEEFAQWLAQLCGQPADQPPFMATPDLRVWAHGPTFDVSILAAAYRAVGLPLPWHYRAPRDTRTAFDLAGASDHSAFMQPFNHGEAHNALDDAISQARCVCEAYRRINRHGIDHSISAPTLASETNKDRNGSEERPGTLSDERHGH